jgi:hypothetical protein
MGSSRIQNGGILLKAPRDDKAHLSRQENSFNLPDPTLQ